MQKAGATEVPKFTIKLGGRLFLCWLKSAEEGGAILGLTSNSCVNNTPFSGGRRLLSLPRN